MSPFGHQAADQARTLSCFVHDLFGGKTLLPAFLVDAFQEDRMAFLHDAIVVFIAAANELLALAEAVCRR